jgi:hypothetical protein
MKEKDFLFDCFAREPAELRHFHPCAEDTLGSKEFPREIERTSANARFRSDGINQALPAGRGCVPFTIAS